MVHCDEHLALTGIHHRVVLGREGGEEGRGGREKRRGEEERGGREKGKGEEGMRGEERERERGKRGGGYTTYTYTYNEVNHKVFIYKQNLFTYKHKVFI